LVRFGSPIHLNSLASVSKYDGILLLVTYQG
jgi:hypothetical protein